MSLFERFRSDLPLGARDARLTEDAAEREALRLIDEGNVCEDEGRIADARQRYEAAIRLAPNLARAHLNRGNLLLATGDTEGALNAYEEALGRNPDYAAAHYNMGNAQVRLGRTEVALAAYRNAIRLQPDFIDAEVALGCVLEQLGRLDDAVSSYRRALDSKPDYAEVHCNLGDVLATLGQYEDAVVSYRRALAIKPNYAVVHCNLGKTLKALGQVDGAVASYRRALEIKPDFADAHNNLGSTLRDLGKLDEAVESYRRALQINNDYCEAHYNLGNALRDLGQLDDAVASYRRALEINPDLEVAHCNLGNVLQDLERFADSLSSYTRALEIRPDFVEACTNRGNALKAMGRLDDAVASYRRAVTIVPDFHMAHCNLGNALLELRQLDEAMASYRRALKIRPDFAKAHTNMLFCLSHDETTDAQTLFAEHCLFGEQFEAPLRASWPRHGNTRDPTRCLQIGFVSGDLRDHAVAYFIEPLLVHLARSPSLSLHAYYNHSAEDIVTKRLRGYFGHWHAIAHLSDIAVAQQISADGIDILIDLSGHTSENRLLSFARKPAPVQASWIGYPCTTGLRAIDYYLADPFFLPPGVFDSQFTEKLVYLPAFAPFLPDEAAPPVNALPALSNGYVTFGTFNRVSKLSVSAIKLWSRLLRALPDARMLLGGMPQDGEYDLLIATFASEGVGCERLSFYPRCGMAEYLALHHQVDMCLDTVPYAGGTTTNHALWMGVPTLTLAGQTPAGRDGAANLGYVGLDAFVANNSADFQEKGLRWANDLATLALVRAGLRERLEQSPLRRPDVIAASVERALRVMWERWCAGLPSKTLDMSLPARPVASASGH